VRVTVIAAGFDGWERPTEPERKVQKGGLGLLATERELRDSDDLGLIGDEFDVPDFLK
jgi:hypothetical protein